MHHVRTLIVALTICAGVLLPPVAAGASPRFEPRVTQLDGIALGDSYSAGVGAGTSAGGCGRTDQSWAEKAFRSNAYMAGSLYLPGDFTQAACGGATISSVTATQLSSITKAHDVATITVGGNDIGFAPRVVACMVGTCPPKSLGIQLESGSWFELRSKLTELYIHDASANGIDAPHDLMAWNDRQHWVRQFAIDDMQVRAAHATGFYFNSDFTGARLRLREFGPFEWSTDFGEHHGLHWGIHISHV